LVALKPARRARQGALVARLDLRRRVNSRPSRLLFDARTPTAWGEVKAYIEMDFAHANENVTKSTSLAVTSGWAPRLRKAYGTIGGLLVGQETGMFHDSDADAELVDFGGNASSRLGGPSILQLF
jgi:Porin subfamily